MNPENNIPPILSIKIIICFFFMAAGMPPGTSWGQKSNYLQINSGYEHIANRDKGMSPLLYSGTGFYVGLAWERTSSKHETEVALDFGTGVQRNKYDNPIDYRRGNVRVATIYNRKEDQRNRIRWGWVINNIFTHRYNPVFVNFNDHYEYFSNIGPAAKYSLPFQLWGREVMVTGSGYFQLVGLMIRPSYTSSYPDGFLRESSSIAKGLVHSAQLIHPGNALNFGLRPGFLYPLKSGNKLALGYDYEFYRLNASTRVTQSKGTWFISLFARL